MDPFKKYKYYSSLLLVYSKSILPEIKSYITNCCICYSQLTITQSPLLGFVILLLCFSNPTAGFLSLIAYFSSLIMGRLIHLSKELLENGFFLYNSVIVGLSLSYIFEFSLLSIVLTIVASLFTLFLSYGLYIFLNTWGLPILNIPFAITASLLYLASVRYCGLPAAQHMGYSFLNIPGLPDGISSLLKTVGILVFLPYDIIGIALLLLMLMYSRINFFLIVSGFYVGILFSALLKGSFTTTYSEIFNFNYSLIALVIGGYLLLPSMKSYLIAFSGVLMSVFILDAASVFWSSYGIPVFTLPFIVVVLSILFVLKTTKFPYIPIAFIGSPEQNLEHYLNYHARFKVLTPQPSVPYSGEWKVYQAFDDIWTHKGAWKHAVDFIVVNKNDNTYFRNIGMQVQDYYSYYQPVLSPVTGYVTKCYDELMDNEIGYVDQHNFWGNFIMIRSLMNYYVVICHLNQNSLQVKIGDYVTTGQQIARCGNSGYSPMPHIHMQCQLYDYPYAPTIPFLYNNCSVDGVADFGTNELKSGQFVKMLPISPVIRSKLQFILDESFSYDVIFCDKKESEITITVKIDFDGTYYLFENMTKAKLYFAIFEGGFSFIRFEGSKHSKLHYFFLALPRIPLVVEKIQWIDTINPTLLDKNSASSSFIKSFHHKLFNCSGRYSFASIDTIVGTISSRTLFGESIIETYCELDHFKGFNKIRIKDNRGIHELRKSEKHRV